MMHKRHLGLLLGLASILAVLVILPSSSLALQTSQDWPPFTMAYREMAYREQNEVQSIQGRLTWHSRWDWKDEILEDTSHLPTQFPPRPSSAGTSFIFQNGTYIVRDSRTDSTTRSRQVEEGFAMIPRRWMVPGYMERLRAKARQGKEGYLEVPISEPGRVKIVQQGTRPCLQGPSGEPLDPTCTESRPAEEEFIFDANTGIPLRRTVRIENRVVREFIVDSLDFEQTP